MKLIAALLLVAVLAGCASRDYKTAPEDGPDTKQVRDENGHPNFGP